MFKKPESPGIVRDSNSVRFGTKVEIVAIIRVSQVFSAFKNFTVIFGQKRRIYAGHNISPTGRHWRQRVSAIQPCG
ncbi:hypothetical protein Desku_2306 [Desulfofundulus kuznetsovii DSM 6115]|uniref:Uncharacterized protein n=1 Tax=Desulfofundulus kuznetsovii (strain DSM 6115 / VKM B-1805 / 17) TaxID=760568 RepID=A0AAU8PCB2_DESK7|nr:hypothetical protein Desku_2306 [Desulfofundulus kuznetsovii DSM 6115]